MMVYRYEIGRLLCGDVREMLESEIFAGRNIRYREGKGWLSRLFELTGPDAAMTHARLSYYLKCLGADAEAPEQ